MGKELTKVVFKPDVTEHTEFIIIVNPEEYKKWKEGDTTIPLAEVVDSFQVLFSDQGNQGLLGKPSKQQLENVFGTSKDVDVVERILKDGKEQTGGAIKSGLGSMNLAKGSFSVDTRGKSTSGI